MPVTFFVLHICLVPPPHTHTHTHTLHSNLKTEIICSQTNCQDSLICDGGSTGHQSIRLYIYIYIYILYITSLHFALSLSLSLPLLFSLVLSPDPVVILFQKLTKLDGGADMFALCVSQSEQRQTVGGWPDQGQTRARPGPDQGQTRAISGRVARPGQSVF